MKRRLEYFIFISLYSISDVMAMHFNHDEQRYLNVNLT